FLCGMRMRDRLPISRQFRNLEFGNNRIFRDFDQRYFIIERQVSEQRMYRNLGRTQRTRIAGIQKRHAFAVPSAAEFLCTFSAKVFGMLGFAEPENNHASTPYSILPSSSLSKLMPNELSNRSLGLTFPSATFS